MVGGESRRWRNKAAVGRWVPLLLWAFLCSDSESLASNLPVAPVAYQVILEVSFVSSSPAEYILV